jgi:hypothetical protein
MPYIYGDLAYYLQYLYDSGFYDYVLPFLLIFTVLFAILEKTRIFGDNKSNINLVFSLIVSAIVVLNPEIGITRVINNYLPGVSLVIIVAITFMLLTAMFTSGNSFRGFSFTIAAIIALIAILWSLSDPVYGAGWEFIYYTLPPGIFNLLVVLALIIAVIFAVKGGAVRRKAPL